MTELSATSAEPAYLNRLALKHLPFSNAVSESAFYDGSHIKQRRLLLQHLLRATRRPVQLQAVSGTGKTTLVAQLQKNASSDLRFCSFPQTDDQQLCNQQLLSQLGTDAPQTATETELQRYLQQLRRLNITPVLIVDDFESLNDLARKRLSNYLGWQDEDDLPLWQAVVCCKTPVSLAEVDFQALDIPPLELSELAPYLSQRLSAAGYQDELPFSDKTLRRFYRLSSGNPAKLNQLAHQHLLEPVGQRQWSFKLPQSLHQIGRWSAAVIVVLVIVVVLLNQQDINEWIASQSVPQEEILSLPEVYEPAEVATVIAGEPEQIIDEPRQELAELLAEIPSPPVKESAEPTQTVIEPEVVANEIVSATEAVPQEAVENDAELELVSEHEVEVSNGTDWILQQKSAHFTFQLMGSWETAEVDEFIEKNALSGDYARFTSLRDGEPWHVLVYGVYPSKQAALKASNQWSAPMNTLPTWLRRFDSVQKQIKEKGVTP